MMVLCVFGQVRCVFNLLSWPIYSDAEVDQEGPNERAPLHEAAEAGYKNIVELLLHKGADTVRRDSNDCTPYDLASKKNHTKVCI